MCLESRYHTKDGKPLGLLVIFPEEVRVGLTPTPNPNLTPTPNPYIHIPSDQYWAILREGPIGCHTRTPTQAARKERLSTLSFPRNDDSRRTPDTSFDEALPRRLPTLTYHHILPLPRLPTYADQCTLYPFRPPHDTVQDRDLSMGAGVFLSRSTSPVCVTRIDPTLADPPGSSLALSLSLTCTCPFSTTSTPETGSAGGGGSSTADIGTPRASRAAAAPAGAAGFWRGGGRPVSGLALPGPASIASRVSEAALASGRSSGSLSIMLDSSETRPAGASSASFNCSKCRG